MHLRSPSSVYGWFRKYKMKRGGQGIPISERGYSLQELACCVLDAINECFWYPDDRVSKRYPRWDKRELGFGERFCPIVPRRDEVFFRSSTTFLRVNANNSAWQRGYVVLVCTMYYLERSGRGDLRSVDYIYMPFPADFSSFFAFVLLLISYDTYQCFSLLS